MASSKVYSMFVSFTTYLGKCSLLFLYTFVNIQSPRFVWFTAYVNRLTTESIDTERIDKPADISGSTHILYSHVLNVLKPSASSDSGFLSVALM